MLFSTQDNRTTQSKETPSSTHQEDGELHGERKNTAEKCLSSLVLVGGISKTAEQTQANHFKLSKSIADSQGQLLGKRENMDPDTDHGQCRVGVLSTP